MEWLILAAGAAAVWAWVEKKSGGRYRREIENNDRRACRKGKLAQPSRFDRVGGVIVFAMMLMLVVVLVWVFLTPPN